MYPHFSAFANFLLLLSALCCAILVICSGKPLAQNTENTRSPDISIATHIVGGSTADPLMVKRIAAIGIPFWSWGASLRSKRCTGTVLRKNKILTAAHCFFDSNLLALYSRISITVGSTDISDYNNGAHFQVDSVYVHKDYVPNSADNRNDVAIIYLTGEIPSDKYFPVSMVNTPSGEDLVEILGYGATQDGGKPSKIPNYARQINKNFNTCKNAVPSNFQTYLDSGKQVCGVPQGFPNTGTPDICQGDSGGPIFKSVARRRFYWRCFCRRTYAIEINQHGITSFSSGSCGDKNRPSFFTKVSTYRDIINAMESNIFSTWTRKYKRP